MAAAIETDTAAIDGALARLQDLLAKRSRSGGSEDEDALIGGGTSPAPIMVDPVASNWR
jgi:hypothetical protein